jgi:hypothetical protein
VGFGLVDSAYKRSYTLPLPGELPDDAVVLNVQFIFSDRSSGCWEACSRFIRVTSAVANSRCEASSFFTLWRCPTPHVV